MTTIVLKNSNGEEKTKITKERDSEYGAVEVREDA